MNATELRELDAFIAEHVMGWEPETRKMYAGMEKVQGYGLNKHLSLGSPHRDFIPTGMFPREHFTTNPAAAMMVLEKCLEKTSFNLIKHKSGYGIVASMDVVGETLPLAACLFAKQIFSK